MLPQGATKTYIYVFDSTSVLIYIHEKSYVYICISVYVYVYIGWTSKESKSRGIPFYINEYTKETTWEKPTEAAKKPMSDSVQALHLLKKHSVSDSNLYRVKI
jgi:hypothetical protein